MSQFDFLQREWAAVFEAASNAEGAVHADPRTACFCARLLEDAEADATAAELWGVE